MERTLGLGASLCSSNLDCDVSRCQDSAGHKLITYIVGNLWASVRISVRCGDST